MPPRSVLRSCWVPSAREGVPKPGPALVPADTPLRPVLGLPAFEAVGTGGFSQAQTARVRPLCPSNEPGLTGEAEPGSQGRRRAPRCLLPWRSLLGGPGPVGAKRPGLGFAVEQSLEGHEPCRQAGRGGFWPGVLTRWGWGWEWEQGVPGLGLRARCAAPPATGSRGPTVGCSLCPLVAHGSVAACGSSMPILREIIGLGAEPGLGWGGDVSPPGLRGGCLRPSRLLSGWVWVVVGALTTCSCPQGVGKARARSCSASQRRTGWTTPFLRASSW